MSSLKRKAEKANEDGTHVAAIDIAAADDLMTSEPESEVDELDRLIQLAQACTDPTKKAALAKALGIEQKVTQAAFSIYTIPGNNGEPVNLVGVTIPGARSKSLSPRLVYGILTRADEAWDFLATHEAELKIKIERPKSS